MINIIAAVIVGFYGGFGGFGGYMTKTDMSGINQVLSAHGIEEFSNLSYGWGGLGYGIVGKVWIGGGGFGANQTVTSDSLEIILSGGGGYFELGYTVYEKKNMLGGVSIGLGGFGYNLILNPTNGDQTFDSLLVNPRRSSRVIIASSISFMPSLNFVVFLNRFAGVFLKLGYAVYTRPVWKLSDGGEVLNPPDWSRASLVASFNVIFGGGSPGRGENK